MVILTMRKAITKDNIENILSLTPMQQSLLFIYMMNDTTNEYIEQIVLKIKGELSIQEINKAWNHLINKYEILRTIFKWEKLSSPIQIILKEIEAPIHEIKPNDYLSIDSIKERELNKGLSLDENPYRICIKQSKSNEIIMVITFHHILWDGWSSALLISEFKKICSKIINKKHICKEKRDSLLKQYLKIIKNCDMEEEKNYWKGYLQGCNSIGRIDALSNKDNNSYGEGEIHFTIKDKEYTTIKEICKINKHTISEWLYTGLGIALNKFSGDDDVIFGSTFSGRNIDINGIEKEVGLFINTLPIRIKIQKEKSVREQVKRVAEDIQEKMRFEATSLTKVKEYSGLKGDENLFDILIVYENYPMDKRHDEGVEVEILSVREEAHFGITIVINEKSETELNVCIKFKKNRFSRDLIQVFGEIYTRILVQMVEGYSVPIGEIEIIHEKEKIQILEVFNDTEVEYPRDKSVQEIFEDQVKNTPEKIAVVSPDNEEIPYKELDKKSNELACALIKKGIKEEIIGIIADKSIEMIISILAILKAGGAYLPLDPSYPRERIRFMLKDCNARLLLVGSHIKEDTNYEVEAIRINRKTLGMKIDSLNKKSLENKNTSSSLAYIMYTSGSTGNPKGVMVEHKNIIRLVKNPNYIEFESEDKILQTGSLAFDAATFEIWGALLNGLQLYLAKENHILDIDKLEKLIKGWNISILWLTAPLFNEIANSKAEIFNTVRYLLVGGDVLNPTTINKILKKCKGIKIINGYGPTENTTFSTCFEIDKEYKSNIPIGKPISNSRVYILDKNNNLQPVNVSGELCVAGDGLARGYLNREDLTKERFVEDPFRNGDRMYKTGDLARWLPDGNIDFLGRIDYQVKIRGYRVEVGEVENALVKHSCVKEAIVITRKEQSGNKYLCAYITKENDISVEEIKESLRIELPEYMVPSAFIELEKLPLTANGKVDRKALLEMEVTINRENEYEGPRNHIEEMLVKLWEELLEVEGIGINDNFFDIGGHSLRATILSGRIQRELEAEITVKDIFEAPSIKELAEKITTLGNREYEELRELDNKEYYATSSAQRRIYAIQMMDKSSIEYNIPMRLELEGKIDKARIIDAVNKLIQKHEVLRTSFHIKGEEIVQKIEKNTRIELEYIEKLGSSKEEIEEIIISWIKPFDLEKAPLIRGGIIKLEEEKHILILDMHHIISDGTTMGILAEDFVKAYSGEKLKANKVQYKEYANWENQQKIQGNLEKQREYWKKEYEGEIPVLELPTDGIRGGEGLKEGKEIAFEIEETIIKELRNRMTKLGGTLYMGLMAGFSILLSKYSGQEDIIVGMPIAGRRHSQMEKVAGIFINTLTIRSNPSGYKKTDIYLKEIKDKLLKAYENQEYPYEELVEEIGVKRDVNRNPLFDVMLVLQNTEMKDMRLEDIRIKPSGIDNRRTKFDISLFTAEIGEKLECSVRYRTKLFKEETIRRMIKHFKKILKEMVYQEDESIKEIEMILTEEKRQIIEEFNATKTDYQRNKTVKELFEDQVKITPDNIAVVYKNNKLTYRQLNDRANSLARILREKEVTSESIVGIMVKPSLEMMVGILGILKAGGAYLPIDPEYPIERVKYMLKDSGTNIIVSKRQLIDENIAKEQIYLDDKNIYEENTTNLESLSRPDDLSYVIYTSGTTGKSKGVLIKNSSLVNYVDWFKNKASLSCKDKSVLISSFCFDLGYTSVYPPLLTGAGLHILDKESYLVPEKLIYYIKTNGITYMKLTPSQFTTIVNDKDFTKEIDKTLRLIVLGGEAINVNDLEKLKNVTKDIKVLNHYGPTETTIGAIVKDVDFSRLDAYKQRPTIGKPINNAQIWIIDNNDKLAPVGVPGEICISGEGLSKGYLNRIDLTKQKFIHSPFAQDQIMYKTGDKGRWLPNGEIEFLGRLDNQVKIRGYRVELGEVKNTLLRKEGIEETIVIAKEDQYGNRYLCAYIVADEKITVSQIREYLSDELPQYMLPAYYIKIQKMPLTPNGKIDKKALPKIEDSADSEGEYEEARNEKEEKLVKVWEEVLTRKKIGINENFFEIGGDSIKALQIAARLQKYNLKLEIQKLFKYPTIKQLSYYIKDNKKIVKQGEINGEIELTAIQKRFFEENLIDKHHFNQSVMLYKKEGFNEDITREAFKEIIKHHDALRMVYKEGKRGVVQINKGIEESDIDIKVCEINEKEYEERIESKIIQMQGSISLGYGPLMKVAMFKTIKGDYLLIIIHHLVVDGVSWRIILEDFSRVYNLLKKRKVVELPLKTTSFKEWSKEIIEYSISKDLLKEKNYWRKIEEEKIDILPRDNEIEESKIRDSESITINLSKEETTNLLEKVNRAYNTEINDILLSALGLAMKEWTDRDKALIELEGHGREEIIKEIDVTRTVGWFTTKYPVILEAKENNDIGNLIKETKEMLRKISNKGIGYGILKYITSKENIKDINFYLKPEISFNYLGQLDTEVSNELFELATISTGNERSIRGSRPYTLEISGFISKEELNISVGYNKTEYEEDSINKLLKKYKKSLERITTHCINKKETEMTPSDFSSSNIDSNTIASVYSKYGMNNVKDIYSLSPMQEGMLFHHVMDKKSSAYFEQVSMDINGELNLNLVEKSFNKLIKKYDVLRTVFIYEEVEKPRQVLLKARNTHVNYEDISSIKEEKDKIVKEIEQKDRENGFDLTKDIPMRITIIKTNDKKYRLIWSFHHIIMDGWCLGIIMKYFTEFYVSFKRGEEVKLESVTPYSQYIKWLETKDEEEGIKYWKEYLEEYEGQVSLPGAYNKIDKKYKSEEYKISIESHKTEQLSNIAKKNNVTMNTIFEVLWGILLSRYNNTNDVVYGTAVAGRPAEILNVEEMVGLFINTVPVRIKHNEEETFQELINRTQIKGVKAREYDYISLAKIQRNSGLKQDLINHVIAFENYPIEESMMEGYDDELGYKVEGIEFFQHTNYDFGIIIAPGNNLDISFKYNSCKYDKRSIERMSKHLQKIINQVIDNDEIKITDIDILTEEENREILFGFNNTKEKYSKDKTIQELFEEQVKRTPDNIAVVYGNKRLTYRELNERANSLARLLREEGVKEESIVGIMVERSLEMVVGILGILKAGGAYLPIDPNYPKERIQYLIKDSQSKILLVQDKTIENLDGVKILNLEGCNINDYDKSNLKNINKSSDLAYVIYTSGSTGKPKGVMIEHQSLVNRLGWMQKQYTLRQEDVILQKTTYTFDVSVWELFWWGIYGASVCLLGPNHEKEPEKILEAIEKENITVMHFVPSMLSGFLKYIEETDMESRKTKLRQVFTSGEALQINQVKDFYKYFSDVKLSNLYGPTEATIDVTYYDCENKEYYDAIPIGRAIDNTQIYIIDKSQRLSPIGVAGELCISGDGLARGYLNREGLTKEKFVDNPFADGEKMYKTGDLARWLIDGNIEYLGRIDHQVKIRGYRIELGEIENELLKHERIKEAVVIEGTDKNGSKYLCGYIVADKDLVISQIREYLGSKLPQYMIPAYFVMIDKMPLTSNGKIDRKSLPKLDESIESEAEYEEARNEKEEKLIKVWEEVLTRSGIGINDNFFEIGGDSIKAIQIAARLQRYNLKLEIGDLFKYPTIKQLSYYIDDNVKIAEQGEISGQVGLIPIQKWFFEKNITDKHHFNQSVMLFRKEGFKEEIIREAFGEIIKHHDALRMVYEEGETEVIQIIKAVKESKIDIKAYEVVEEGYEEIIVEKSEELQNSINLSEGPLIKIGVFRTKKGDYLLIVIHHLVVDGVSWRILLEDYTTAYKQLIKGQVIELPLKTTSLKKWADEIRKYSMSSELLEEREYWQTIENIEIENISRDNEIKESKVGDSEKITFNLTKEETRLLLEEANRAYNTEINDILLSALGLAMNLWTGKDKALIDLEGHGREEITKEVDITRTVGWFTSQYPIILEVGNSVDLGKIIKDTKEMLRKIPNKGIGYGILKYITPKEYKKGMDFNLEPEIRFNYLGQFGKEVSNDLFEIGDIDTGRAASDNSERFYSLEISGIIANEELNISVSYNKKEYRYESIKELIEKYKKGLYDIINHCIKKEETEMTLSDFSASDTEGMEFAEISDAIDDLFDDDF